MEKVADDTVREIQLAQELKSRAQSLLTRIVEFHRDVAEHQRVLATLRACKSPEQTCYRLVGSVLCERKVSEVIPELEHNIKNLETTIEKLTKQREQYETEANGLLGKHNELLQELGKRESQAAAMR